MKKLKYIIIAILICLPTIIAVKSYFDTKNAPLTSKTAEKIQIDDIKGDSFAFDKKATDGKATSEEVEELIAFFLDINSRATKIEALPASVVGQKSYCVTVSSPFREESCQYYMSTTPSLCYLVKQDGSTYQLTEADGSAFLSTKFAECLYSGATQPTITLSGEHSPAPTSATWRFRNYKGEFIDADSSRFVSDKEQSFDVNGALSVTFDIAPDICKVVLVDEEGNQLFDETADKLSEAPIKEKMTLSVSVRAEWFEDPAREYCGVREYSFKATVKPAATFNLASNSVTTGRFISIVASNVDDASKISFSSEPELPVSPKFYMDGERAYALLPIPLGTEEGLYTLKLAYGATEKNVDLTVTPFEYGAAPLYLDFDASVVSTSFSETARTEFADLAKRLAVETSSAKLYDGGFGKGVPMEYAVARGFGRPTVVNGDDTAGFFYPASFFIAYSSIDVTAANAGKVVFAGESALTGKLVVIEHGYGLKTWYWSMDSVSVEVGATVAKGDALGKVGKTGFTGTEMGLNFAMSVGDIFVCPYDTWENAEGGGGIPMFDATETTPAA